MHRFSKALSRRAKAQALVGAPAALFILTGCSHAPSLPSFEDVSSAPPVIQTAARAVVLVTMPGYSATASFISPEGLLLTNNHVLGVGVCPVEGCYASLTWNFQRGSPVQSSMPVFLVPLAIDIGLDMAVLQATTGPGGAPLSTPDYLTIDARTPAQLEDTHVNIVGHPEGSVKKWTSGDAVWSDGDWVWTTAFVLPGNSGSPVLDDHGHVVGLLHRSADGLNLVTADGVNESSIFTASAALIAAMAAPLPPTTWSVAAPTTQGNAVANELVYLAAHTQFANVQGSQEDVLEALGAACDAALAGTYPSPEAATSALQPCLDAESWIECRQDVTKTFALCPVDLATWQQRFQQYFEFWRSFNGELELDEMSFAIASLSFSTAAGVSAGGQMLMQALDEAQPPLDFHVALHLAAFQIDTYQGQSVVGFTRNYASVPDYPLSGIDLVDTILWLANEGALDSSDMGGLLSSLHADPSIDLGTKLLIEQAEYERGILP